MYYRKGTDQHLTFLRNMREAHAMYPFTGKRDKELFDKALAELLFQIPILSANLEKTSTYLALSAKKRRWYRLNVMCKFLEKHQSFFYTCAFYCTFF
uniref:Uncharacterized protein n=1 Tax=Biomphalaria glabrata TaxID=6526 RepID=A0A2C9LPS6_BIOGL